MATSRLPKGALMLLADAAGVPKTTMCGYIHRDLGVTQKRAVELEECCISIGLPLTKEQWIFAETDELKKMIREWFKGKKKQPQ